MPTSKRDRTHPDDNLFACSLTNLRDHIATVQPQYLISILGPNDGAEWPIVNGVDHLRLEIDDVHRCG